MPAPAGAKVYQKCTVMKTTLAAMIAFHQKPDALAVLTPPPIFVRVNEDKRVSFADGDIRFTLWLGFIPVRWWARHEAGPTLNSFADVMMEGPMAYWRHEHIFTEVEGGVELFDRLTFAHRSGVKGLLTRLIFDGLPLRFLFFYRHLRTRMAVSNSGH